MTLDEAIKHSEEVANKCDMPAEQSVVEQAEHHHHKCAAEHRQLAEWLRELKQLKEQRRWIPCSERLPEDMQEVLVWFEYYRYGDYNCMYQTYGFGYVCDGKWSSFINGETGWQDARIIAWMPLPEPYKEGSEGE